jgi:hypothetical protein
MKIISRVFLFPFLAVSGAVFAQKPFEDVRHRPEFTTLVAHWAEYGDPGYQSFIEEAKPDVAQLGFYGGHFWSLAHTPQYKGYPAHFPVQGLNECGTWFEEKNAALHKMGVKVVGHFNVEFLVGDPESPEGPRGFFKFYRDLWDEKELGPKPVADPVDFLEKDKDGKPQPTNSYSIGGMKEYFACLRNPNWQTVLKAWTKRGIERGVDGYIANYFYRHNCLCEHCQKGFKGYLGTKYKPDQLKRQFKIEDLEKHVFDEIVCWHDPKESTPLRREMLRWSQISNKEVFDKVFIEYGRSLKPDLMAAQWNHLGDFSQIRGDERSLLPPELWGAREDYLWYSTGDSAHWTDLAKGQLGDGTLRARYIRGVFEDKPFTLGKYEGTRIRAAIAELAANGGAPMGFYTNFREPIAREIIVKYYRFMDRYDAIYKGNRPQAEVVLVYPRKAVHAADLKPLEAFAAMGRKLLDEHVLFDVVPDLPPDRSLATRYAAVIRPGVGDQDTLPDAVRPMLSQFKAPQTMRIAANRPAGGGEIDLHFVNYNREEPPRMKDGSPSSGGGAKDEKPIAAGPVGVDFVLPAGAKIASVEFITPEEAEPKTVAFKLSDGRIQFETPGFLVYGVARMKFAPAERAGVPKVAGITTVYQHNSHSDLILGRMLETDTLDGRGTLPGLHMPALFADQMNPRDTSRDLASRHGVRLCENVKEALTLGGDKLAVDAVLLVAEHGEYPDSPTGQTQFPKRRLFSEIAKVIEASGKPVPVFNDKHLADNWDDAKWIYDEAKRLKIPMMAGSSLPGCWRYPAADVKRDAKVKEIVGVSYHTPDAYGFHGMEVLQCLAERRAGGETGIKRIQVVKGAEVWTCGLFDRALLDAALGKLKDRPIPAGKKIEEMVKEPLLFHMEYVDGLKSSLLTLNGGVIEWTAAWRYAEAGETVESAAFSTQEERPFYHFALMLQGIEKMVKTGQPTWPVERTLLTSGALSALIAAQSQGKTGWIDTPHLNVAYRSTWDWQQPSPPPPGRDLWGK